MDSEDDLKYLSIDELVTLLLKKTDKFYFGNYSEFIEGVGDGYAIAMTDNKNSFNLIVAQSSGYIYDYYDYEYGYYTNPFTVHIDYDDGVGMQTLEFQTKEDCFNMLIDFNEKNNITLNKKEYKAKAECKDYYDLVEFAKKNGYKEGWAYYLAKKLNYLIPTYKNTFIHKFGYVDMDEDISASERMEFGDN